MSTKLVAIFLFILLTKKKRGVHDSLGREKEGYAEDRRPCRKRDSYDVDIM